MKNQKMQIGDIVQIIGTNIIGRIIKIENNYIHPLITILTENGNEFRYPYEAFTKND